MASNFRPRANFFIWKLVYKLKISGSIRFKAK